jgi:hypothetical protein
MWKLLLARYLPAIQRNCPAYRTRCTGNHGKVVVLIGISHVIPHNDTHTFA